MAENSPKNLVRIEPPYQPWPHQRDPFEALLSGRVNRVVTVWHRRAGKDITAFNAMWMQAVRKVGNYGYFFPYAVEARRSIWDGIDNDGRRITSYIPDEVIADTHDTFMRITLVNGSTIQVMGTENIDAIMGQNYQGVVMSEYSLQDPGAWNLIEPILTANGGWAWFTYTPRGRHNHGYDLYQAALTLEAKKRPWYVSHLGIHDTGIMSDEQLDDMRERGVQESFLQQEYYADFTVETESKYFAIDMERAEGEARINPDVKWDPNQLVHTVWDLGVRDATIILFAQKGKYNQWHWIDEIEGHNAGMDHYAKLLHEKPYAYGTHLMPHDGRRRDFGTGNRIEQTAAELGIPVTIVPRAPKTDQIQAAHRLITMSHFHQVHAAGLVRALYNYEREYDEKLKTYKNQPLHNWASHWADALMVLAMGEDYIWDQEDMAHLVTRCTGADFNPWTAAVPETERRGTWRTRHRRQEADDGQTYRAAQSTA
jgi:phage terminase large subunit